MKRREDVTGVERRSLSRRGFLRLGSLGGAAVVLAACAPKVVEVTKIVKEVVKETVIIEGTPQVVEKEVTRVVKEEVTKIVVQKEVKFVNIWTEKDTPFIVKLLEEFDETHPDLKLTIIQTTNAEAAQKLQTLIAAGMPPDAGYWSPGTFTSLAPKGAFFALDEYFARDADVVKPDDFFPLSVQYATVKGKIYGIPWSINIQAFVSVPKLYDDAGVDQPDSNTWTWQDFARIAPSIATGEGGSKKLAIANQSGHYYTFLWAWGGDVLDEANEHRPMLTKAENIEAFKFLRGLYEADVVLSSEYGEAFGGLRPMLAAGRIAHAIHGIGTWNFMKRESEVPWDFWHIPAGPKGRAAPVIPVSFQVVAGAENPEGGWELVKWITDPSYAGRVFAEQLQSPARRSLREPFIKAAQELAPHANILPDVVEYGHVPPRFRLPIGGELEQVVSSEVIDPAIERGEVAIEEALEIAQKKMEEIYAESVAS